MIPTPEGWIDPAPDRPIPFFSAVRDDVRAHIPPAEQGGGRSSRLLRRLKIAATSSGFHLCLIYRLSHTVRGRWGPPGRAIASGLFWWGRHFYGCSIAPTARIQGGLILPHPQGIVIGAGAVVGARAWIFQNVTIGGSPDKTGLPVIGADARVYAGAVLTGQILVGDNVVIGANAVINRDLPSRSIALATAFEVGPLPDRFLVRSTDGADLP